MKEKKPYKKPKVKKIVLRTEERVLGVCKYETYGGPGGFNCVTRPGGTTPCSDLVIG